MEVKGPSVHWSELSSDSGTHYCVNCGRSDETVRFVSYPYVFSLIFVSYRKAFSGIWCARHRLWYGSLACLITLIFGWFGIPWGLIFTPAALFQLARGGIKDEEANARILSALGEEKLAKGDRDGAIRCFEQSLRFQDQQDTRERLKTLYVYRSPSSDSISRIIWQFAIIVAIPLFLYIAGSLTGLLDYGIGMLFGNVFGEEWNIFILILAWVPLIIFLFIGIVLLRKILEWTIGLTKIASVGLVNLLVSLFSLAFVYAVASGNAAGKLIEYMYYGIYFNSAEEMLSTIVSLFTRGGLYFLSNAIASGELWGILYMIILPGFAALSLIVNIPLMANVVKWQNVLKDVSSKGGEGEKGTAIGAWSAIAILACGFMFLYWVYPQQRHVDMLAGSDHYFNGMYYLDSEKFDQAITEFEQASQLRLADPEARLGLGYAYFYQEDYEPAAEVFSDALEIHPESFDLLESAGWSHYHLGNSEVAKEHLEAALRIVPDAAWSHLGLGWIYLESDPEASIESFELVLSQYPDSADAHLGLGLAYYATQDNQRALDELEIAAQDEYSEPLAYYWMGDIYLGEEKYQLAKDAFAKAIEVFPDYYDAHIGEANLYIEFNDPGKALESLKTAISLQPENALGYIYASIVHIWLGEHQDGLEQVEQAIYYDPENQMAHAVKSMLLRGAGEDEAAESELELALAFETVDFQSARFVASALSGMHRFDEAVKYLEETFYLLPGSPDVDYYVNLAGNYSVLKMFDAAHQALDNGFELDQDNTGNHIARASIYTDQENLDAAQEQLKIALSQEPENEAAHAGLSFVYFQMGEIDQAVHEAELAIENNKYYGGGYPRLAFAYHAQGRLDEALDAAQEAIRLIPTSDVAHYILGLCYMEKAMSAEAIQEFEKFLHYYYDRAYVRDYKIKAEEYLATLNSLP